MPLITIGGRDYPVYASLEDADDFMMADATAYGDAWREAEEESRKRSLVTSTRAIDAALWQGEPTDPPAAFPRSGLTYPDGGDVDPATVPQRVIDASILLGAWYIEGSDIQNAAAAAAGLKRMKADTVELEYSRMPTLSGTAAPIFPSMVLDLIGFWLAGGRGGVRGLGAARSYDTCKPSGFKPPFKPAGGY